jgi:hypothetical protein
MPMKCEVKEAYLSSIFIYCSLPALYRYLLRLISFELFLLSSRRLRKSDPTTAGLSFGMALRRSFALPQQLLRPAARISSGFSKQQRNRFATAVPPVTQDATGSRGPTAMVFLNMGGPSTTDEVGDFLSRLFVRPHPFCIRFEQAL